jgi:hypothetical protein
VAPLIVVAVKSSVSPTHNGLLLPAVGDDGVWLIVTEVEYVAAEHPPPAAISFVIVYVSAVLDDKLICPVDVLTNTNPAGVALNVPALAPGGKVGEGLGLAPVQ